MSSFKKGIYDMNVHKLICIKWNIFSNSLIFQFLVPELYIRQKTWRESDFIYVRIHKKSI